ncbi:hypothetical protein [Pseudomonas sp. EA_105y_Pfl2_R69]|uniref:hypothetical protein n=1 Tax=Pseudomonas sp. EA_105y_Pfl2_R69 TaxID=3088683 RepID=UPI0030DB9E08
MPISQCELHGIAVQCGFKIVQFSDHPDFFSSWSITVNKGGHNYLIEHEGRDGWLIFYRENTPAKFEELDKKFSHAMSDHEKANQCEAWLLAAK